MITAKQCAAGRTVLKWSRAELSQVARVTEEAIAGFEEKGRQLNDSSLQALRWAFEANGLALIEDGACAYEGPLRGITPNPTKQGRGGELE